MNGEEVYGLLENLSQAETKANLLESIGNPEEKQTAVENYATLTKRVSELTPENLLEYHRYVQALREVDKADARQSERLKQYNTRRL